VTSRLAFDHKIPDRLLLRDCREDLHRAGGPGGQKRNKTANSVRLTHLPTGIVAVAVESRSLRENRIHALRRLRLKLAARIREPVDLNAFEQPAWLQVYVHEGRLRISSTNPLHPAACAIALDVLSASRADPSRAAANLGVSLASLLRLLASHSTIWQAANRQREQFALRPLTKR
jgi:hypothetical protein